MVIKDYPVTYDKVVKTWRDVMKKEILIVLFIHTTLLPSFTNTLVISILQLTDAWNTNKDTTASIINFFLHLYSTLNTNTRKKKQKRKRKINRRT